MARLLIVEDDSTSSRILQSLLLKRSHAVHLAPNVADAITMLERNTLVDLVVLDNQLQGEFGWQFLEYIRKDFVFRSVPVLIYTGSSDRNSVLKYLQLGVQKILVKPYNANIIEQEIERALQFDWRSTIFEPADRVSQRLNISLDDYYKSLSSAAEDVRSHVPQLNKLVGTRDLRMFDDHISALQSMALNLGVSILGNATDSIQDALRKDKLEQAIYFINRLVPTARLMHHRSLAHFGLTDEKGEFPSDLFDDDRVGNGQRKQEQDRPVTVKRYEDEVLESVVQNPLNVFADGFRILLERPIFAKGEVVETILEAAPPLTCELADSLLPIVDVEKAPLHSVIASIEQSPGLPERFIAFASLMAKGERLRTLDRAIAASGLSLACCVASVHQWLRIARRERNPLCLEGFAQYNIGVALMARELSLKFDQTHEFTIAGLTSNIGKWLLALHYPAFYGLVLSLGKNDSQSCIDAERRMFGIDHQELGALFLEKFQFPKTMSASAQFVSDPMQAPTNFPRIVCSMVNLATQLAKIRRVGFGGSSGTVTQDDFTKSPAWEALKMEQIKIPLTPPDYLTALGFVTERSKTQVDALFS